MSSDVVPGDTESSPDVFRYDRTTGDTMLVSRTPAGAPAGKTNGCSISNNGRWILYSTMSDAVVSGLPGNVERLILFDARTRSSSIVSRDLAGAPMAVRTFGRDISGDGRYVVYTNLALSPGGGYHDYDIYRYDRTTGTTTRLVHEGEDAAGRRTTLGGSVTNLDGRYVAYLRTPPKGQQVIGSSSLYLLDTETGSTTLVSETPKGIVNGAASPDLSNNGRWLTYDSNVAGLAPGDQTFENDVFLYDTRSGTTTLVSRTPAGAAGNNRSTTPEISGRGRYVVYHSNATDLVTDDDANGSPDVFCYDRVTGTTVLVSRAMVGGASSRSSIFGSVSATGDVIAFQSPSTDLVEDDGGIFDDVFLWTRPQE